MARLIHLYRAQGSNQSHKALCKQPGAVASIEVSVYFDRLPMGKVCKNCMKTQDALTARSRAGTGKKVKNSLMAEEIQMQAVDEPIKPVAAIKAPLPLWGKILILVAAVVGILAIAAVMVIDCTSRHG